MTHGLQIKIGVLSFIMLMSVVLALPAKAGMQIYDGYLNTGECTSWVNAKPNYFFNTMKIDPKGMASGDEIELQIYYSDDPADIKYIKPLLLVDDSYVNEEIILNTQLRACYTGSTTIHIDMHIDNHRYSHR